MKTKEPRFEHDCDECIFLGRHNEHDLYYCPRLEPTVIARYGEEEKYMSGFTFATLNGTEALYEAKQRAIKQGILKI